MSNKRAFTLAEVLITLAIVGVVAAITLPPLITNIQNQIKVKRVQNIKQKFSKATDKMLAMSGMNGYGSTENFVEELKHHLKIAKVCDNDHLNQCWGYDVINLKDGKQWNIADTKTAKNLKMNDNETQEWADTVGIVTADGTSMILSYNKKCDMSTNINPQWTDTQSTSADCVAAIFDYNGGTKPNKFIGDITSKDYKKADVMAFNAGGLGQDCKIELNGKCFTKIQNTTSSIIRKSHYSWCSGDNTGQLSGTWWGDVHGSEAPAIGEAKTLGINNCYYNIDHWIDAVATCGGIDKLPNESDLNELIKFIYGREMPINTGHAVSGLNLFTNDVQTRVSSLGFPTGTHLGIWSNVESSGIRSYYLELDMNGYIHYRTAMRNSGYYIMCSE